MLNYNTQEWNIWHNHERNNTTCWQSTKHRDTEHIKNKSWNSLWISSDLFAGFTLCTPYASVFGTAPKLTHLCDPTVALFVSATEDAAEVPIDQKGVLRVPIRSLRVASNDAKTNHSYTWSSPWQIRTHIWKSNIVESIHRPSSPTYPSPHMPSAPFPS